jgi:hypothetical protein
MEMYLCGALGKKPQPVVSVCGATIPSPLPFYAVAVHRRTTLHSGFLSTVAHLSAVAFGPLSVPKTHHAGNITG